MHAVWKLKRVIVVIVLLASALFVFTTSVEAAPGGDVTISNVSPANQSIAIEIVGNPPEDSGYVNISFTLADGDGGDDAEFYLNTSTDGGGTYVNRLHQINVGNASYHQHETTFNTTNTTYYWSVAYRDGSEDFKTDVFHYRAEARPDPSDTPTPVNGSMFVTGSSITLKCVVRHPDATAPSPPVMNVSFHEYPSGRTLGYDNSSLSSGATATCDTTYYLHYNATKYYWYAVSTDDEFTGNNSSWWYVDTWYNDTEPEAIYHTTGGDIWVEELYVGTEPDMAYYTLGGNINLYSFATFNNPIPADDAVDQWKHLTLSIDVNSTTAKSREFMMRPDGDGSSTGCEVFGATMNWQCVDEVAADDDATFVFTNDTSNYDLDLYNLPNHTGEQHGDQINVTLWFVATNNTGCANPTNGVARSAIRTHSTTHYGDVESLTGAWATYNYTWDLNPETSSEWTWDEIDDLEAGISMKGGNCTQVYVVVDYRPSLSLIITQFYTNDTVDGRWEQIGSDIAEQRTNYTATMHFSGLQFDTDYWWRVRIYNTTTGQQENSSDYHFTTRSLLPEPDTVCYAIGGDIWVEELYIDTEPSSVWYTLGGNITTQYFLRFTNESPASGNHSLWKSLVLSAWAYKGGDPVHYDFTFYTNDTVDESWKPIGILTQQLPNLTVTMSFSGLEWDKTYWWKVRGINETLGANRTSDIFYFKTNYSIQEPNILYYTVGGDIWVELLYVDTEPDKIWYTLGGKMQVGYTPDQPSQPYPADNSEFGIHILDNFSCLVTDNDGDVLDVTFYDASDDSVFGTDTGVTNNTRASVSAPIGDMTNYSWFEWYVVIDDGVYQVTGPTWQYRPGNIEPQVVLIPDEGAVFVPVRRQLVGGTYQQFVRLNWTINDAEGDEMTFHAYVDDPAIGNWDDWISRWHITDATNGTYRQDEMLFDTLSTTYHWRLYLADQYNETDYYMNFTTEFLFWADFNWTVYHATTDDTVLFIDESQNATDYWWYINDVLVSNVSGLNASDQFNMTHKFNISNVYNITLAIRNVSCENLDQMTRFIYIDRNLSLNRSTKSAVTYYGHSPDSSTNASGLCSVLGVTSTDTWIHKYDDVAGSWESYWAQVPDITTDFDITLWDALAVVIESDLSKRINITDSPDQREAYWSEVAALENTTDAEQILTLPAGLNYICWSNISNTTSSSISIGLGANDEIYIYDTQTGTWSRYIYGLGGTEFTIDAYDILVLNLTGLKVITIQDGF